MTHFVVLVIGDDVEGQLAPYHEFECTGEDNQYVQNIDRLPEARADFEKYEDDKTRPLADFIEGWYGAEKIGPNDQPDLAGKHKFGWVRVAPDGAVLEFIDRTNPNKKWDYWRVGGRWGDYFVLREGATGTRSETAWEREEGRQRVLAEERLSGRAHADSALKRDIDWEAMAAERRRDAEQAWAAWEASPRKSIATADFEYGIEVTPEADARWKAHIEAGHSRDTFTWDLVSDLETAEQYVDRRTRRAGVTRAVVIDGQWLERGRAGWFGMFDDAMSADEWDRLYWEMLEKLPNDTRLTVVDCHI